MTSLLQDVQRRLEDPTIEWQALMVGIIIAVTVFETYINVRQRPFLDSRLFPTLPQTLAPYLPASTAQDNYHKSQRYSLDKLAYSSSINLIDLVESIVLLTGISAPVLTVLGIDLGQPATLGQTRFASDKLSTKLYELLGVGHDGNWTLLKGFWNLAGRSQFAAASPLRHSLAFVACMSLVSAILSIPKGLYSNFVLEQKHGFNKMTVKTFFGDAVKGLLVSLAIELPFLAAILKLIERIGGSGILRLVAWLLAVIFAFQIIMIPTYPYLIAPLFNKFTPLATDSPVYPKAKALADRLEFPLGRIWVIDGSKRSSHSNAYFYGLPFLTKHIVLYDTLLEKSSPEEIEAVLAHELGHWKHGHIVILLAVSLIQLSFSLLTFSLLLFNRSLLAAFGFSTNQFPNSQTGPIIVSLLLASLLFAPVSTILHFVMNMISRALEYDADKFASKLGADVASNLKGALVSLHEKNLALTLTDPLYSAYKNSHPTLIERLDALDKAIDKKKSN
ncbi:zinc metalloprotease [Microbotryomycetes sp. JL201]|nr:zinc metalloprotease [Microbotryomycetes sp. JL201]